MNTNDVIRWDCKHFRDISAKELHAVLALRCEVFIIEQHCPYLDPDHKDEHSFHVMGWSGDTLVAVARIVEPGVSYEEVSIGRVATSPAARRTGAGKLLMAETMKRIETIYGKVPVRISAQSYLQKFYEGFGFRRTEKAEYAEDDIPHVEMVTA